MGGLEGRKFFYSKRIFSRRSHLMSPFWPHSGVQKQNHLLSMSFYLHTYEHQQNNAKAEELR